MPRARSIMAGPRERAGPRCGGCRHCRGGPLAFRGIGFAPETIARAAICRAFFTPEMDDDDRLSDFARARRPDRARSLRRDPLSESQSPSTFPL
jgi:hypothetical protein